MPTKSSKARSPSPDSSGRILCIDDRSLSFSNNRHYPSHNKTYSISERPLSERLRLVAQIVLVPLRRRRQESTNRAGHLWACPGHPDKEGTAVPTEARWPGRSPAMSASVSLHCQHGESPCHGRSHHMKRKATASP